MISTRVKQIAARTAKMIAVRRIEWLVASISVVRSPVQQGAVVVGFAL
jgi:hypothetical protein